jgi:cytochrome c-type biogenesis protein CcmH/NrfG
MTGRPGTRPSRSTSGDADETDREVLEEERHFLLRSLDDLDAERAEGNIDDETYARLHADYTARAARVIHRLDGDPVEAVTGPPPVSARRRVLTITSVVVFALVVGVALAYGLGARLPGQTITGNAAVSTQPSAKEQVAGLRAKVRANPNDAATRLALAQALMGTRDGAGALAQFQAAARLDPTNPQPYAYSGWLIRLEGFPDQGLTLLDKAIALDPTYADARFFRGLILFRDKKQPDAAIPEFQQYLVAAPNSPLAPQVRQLLAQAVEAGRAGPSTTTTSTP